MRAFKEMEAAFYEAARQELLDGLKQCEPDQQGLFIRMYGFAFYSDIESIVEHMPREKLDWAMQQVQRTLEKNARVAA